MQRWTQVREGLEVGQLSTGVVVARAPFGVWVDIGVNFPALLLVPNMAGAKDHPIAFDDYPAIGTRLEACIIALGNRGEIGLMQDVPCKKERQ